MARYNKLSIALTENKILLTQQLQKEWDEIEKKAKREVLVRRAKDSAISIAKVILTLSVAGGALVVAVAAPNIAVALSKTTGRKAFFENKNFKKAMVYLRAKKFMRITKSKNGPEMTITDKGLASVLAEKFKNLKIESHGRWDDLWRIVIFDIPNKHKWARDGFRTKLISLGFYKLQESVFVMPHKCEEEIETLASIFNILSYIKLIKTDFIADDENLKEYFNL